MSDPLEVAEHIAIAVRDRAFDLDDLLAWITNRANHHPDEIAEVVIRLASWTPPDDVTRCSNAIEVLRERGEDGAIPRPCLMCHQPMVTRKYRQPGLLVLDSHGMCGNCAAKAWRETKAVAS